LEKHYWPKLFGHRFHNILWKSIWPTEMVN
jgi:hypothetical protein